LGGWIVVGVGLGYALRADGSGWGLVWAIVVGVGLGYALRADGSGWGLVWAIVVGVDLGYALLVVSGVVVGVVVRVGLRPIKPSLGW